METDQFRHTDHRFEWTRAEFNEWVDTVCENHGYSAIIKPVGEASEKVGAPSQMAVFRLNSDFK